MERLRKVMKTLSDNFRTENKNWTSRIKDSTIKDKEFGGHFSGKIEKEMGGISRIRTS
jgi:hypothetical protein